MRQLTFILAILAAIVVAACGNQGDGSLPGPGAYNQINLSAGGTAVAGSAAAPFALKFSSGVGSQIFSLQEKNYTGAFTVVAYSACVLPENGVAAPTLATATSGTTTYTTTVPASGQFTFAVAGSCAFAGQIISITIADTLGNLIKDYFSLPGATPTPKPTATPKPSPTPKPTPTATPTPPLNTIAVYSTQGTTLTSSVAVPAALNFADGISNQTYSIHEYGYTGAFTIVAYEGCILPENGISPPSTSIAPDGTTTYTTTVAVGSHFTFRLAPSCLLKGQVESVTIADTVGDLTQEYFSLNGVERTTPISLYSTANPAAAIVTSAAAPFALEFALNAGEQTFTVNENDFTGNVTIIAYEGCILPETGSSVTTLSVAPDGTTTYTTVMPINGQFTFRTAPNCTPTGQVESVSIADSLGNLLEEYFSVNGGMP